MDGIGVALVAAAYAEVTEGTTGHDFAVGQPALKLGDDDRDGPNLLGESGGVCSESASMPISSRLPTMISALVISGVS